jgi:hypothetical protein
VTAGNPAVVANSTCPATATSVAGVVGADHDGNRVTACSGRTGVADGTVTAAVDPATGRGYVVEDGQSTNPNLLGGYLGVDSQHILTLVGCAGGDYQPGAPDEWNQSPAGGTNNAMASLGMGTFTAPAGPVGPTSPCSPPVIPAPGPGASCGTAQDSSPAWSVPGHGPITIYTSGSATGSTGVAGDFGGNDGASGYLQITSSGHRTGNVTTGGTSKGGGGTVAAGNDGNETQDQFTPSGLPVEVCQH